ncbi:hypothetical protein C0585_04960 [Candidatus Woesearchaeota archaeon]|nr:MAG: hypothetical protein C0585_04960 [Candidatus Woesearchaeota archaeon]
MSLRNNLMNVLIEHYDFYEKGLLSKEVSSDFQVYSRQPWLLFECKENPSLSFRAHDLELGTEEAAYWHSVGQRERRVEFEGFKSIIPYNTKLRGIFRVPGERSVGMSSYDNRLNTINNELKVVDPAFFGFVSDCVSVLK